MNADWFKNPIIYFSEILKDIFLNKKLKFITLRILSSMSLNWKKVIFLVYRTHFYKGNMATILVYLRSEVWIIKVKTKCLLVK